MDEQAANVVALVLARLGEAFDTGDLGPVRDAVEAGQVAAYRGDGTATVPDAPFTPVQGELPTLRSRNPDSLCTGRTFVSRHVDKQKIN